MNKLVLIGIGLTTVFLGCTKNAVKNTFQGEWKIVQIEPPLPNIQKDDTLGLKEPLALFVVANKGDSLMPSMISINGENMALKSLSGDISSLPYSMTGKTGNDYRLETPKGTFSMKLESGNKASLVAEGVTYHLERTE